MKGHLNIQVAVTRMVYLEVIDGCKTKQKQRFALKLLSTFEFIEFSQNDFDWATEMLIQFRLSHNVGMNDCLIAAPAARLGLPLYTHNLKHFAPLLGPLAQKPY
jgi:predicted nucleic acid-binding protein